MTSSLPIPLPSASAHTKETKTVTVSQVIDNISFYSILYVENPTFISDMVKNIIYT